jgi:hypothetical protein
MTRLWFRSTRGAFWLCQIGGWSVYALDRYLSEKTFFPVYFIYLCVAFALTVVVLRPLYRAVYARRPAPGILLVTAVIASVAAAVVWLLVSRQIFVALHLMRPPAPPWHLYLADTFTGALVHHKPFLFLSWSGAYFATKLWLDARERQTTALEAAALAKDAELQALRAQLNPHFLFNVLNSISALIQQDPGRAQLVLDKIAVFLRQALAGTSRRETQLRDEIEALRAYLDIQEIRYEGRLDARVECSAAALECSVPPLLLQPIVENAVKYGMRTSPVPLRLQVLGDVRDRVLELVVIHTGRLLDPEDARDRDDAHGIGLANVRRRLELALAGRHHFELREQPGEVHAILRIWGLEGRHACAS